MTTNTFANGTQMTSTALTPQQMSTLFQTLTLEILGIIPASDPKAYSKVRVNWQTTGQPSMLIGQDVCGIEAVEIDNPYDKIRDLVTGTASSITASQTYYYTRVWQINFTHYGPASFDNARLVRSAMLLDFAHDFLAASNVYLITDTPSPRRVPYELNSQWWERTDLKLRFNEFVTEITSVGSGASVEVLTYNETGQVGNVTLT